MHEKISEEESIRDDVKSRAGSRYGSKAHRQQHHQGIDHSQTHRLKLTNSLVDSNGYATTTLRNKANGSQPYIVAASQDREVDQPQAAHRNALRPMVALRHEQPPYHINIMLKNYGETCYSCKKKIQIYSEHKPNNSEHEKYCRGCQLNPADTMGVNLDLRKICFTVDWTRDFTYAMPETLTEDETYRQQKNEVERFKNDLNDSMKVYSEVGIKLEIRCSKCQYTQGVLKRNIDKTPNILIIHLNRFKRTKDDYIRFHNKINFPERLSLSSITLNSDRVNDSYQLFGLIGLKDNNLADPQWYSVFLKHKGYWVMSEKQGVIPFDINHVKTQELYMLFYRKVNVEGTLITNVI